MLDKNLIYMGDCLEIMQKIDNQSIDMILCDLPYGTTACKWDIIIPFESLWKQYERIIKDNGAIVLFAGQPFSSLLVSSNLKMFKCEWIWEKTKATNYTQAKNHPMKYHEHILVFGKNKVKYFPQMEVGKPYKKVHRSSNGDNAIFKDTRLNGDVKINNGERYPSSIQKFSNPNNNSYHPTEKPVQLCEYLIKTYTYEDDLVLDNCIGSGTTAIACLNTNRNFIGIEKELQYVQISNQRIQNILREG